MKQLPNKIIGVAVITNQQGEVLIDRRLSGGAFGGLWEFPGGKIEADETIENCITREIKEELALDIEVGVHLITVNHSYADFQVTLIVHHCHYLGGSPQPLESQEVCWSKIEHLHNFSFPEANYQIIDMLTTSFRER